MAVYLLFKDVDYLWMWFVTLETPLMYISGLRDFLPISSVFGNSCKLLTHGQLAAERACCELDNVLRKVHKISPRKFQFLVIRSCIALVFAAFFLLERLCNFSSKVWIHEDPQETAILGVLEFIGTRHSTTGSSFRVTILHQKAGEWRQKVCGRS